MFVMNVEISTFVEIEVKCNYRSEITIVLTDDLTREHLKTQFL